MSLVLLLIFCVVFVILLAVALYFFFRVKKKQVEAQLARERYLAELEAQKKEFAEKDVNVWRAKRD